ncbi:MAG: class II aldolase/adducin family protein [Campylobacterales bacterium]
MKNLWDDKKAKEFKDELGLRVYTSNLLGESDELVLHGGGNTSVKLQKDGEDILYVKGSGWDLVSIQKEGFAPVKLDALIEMSKMQSLSDSDMVRLQREAMIDSSAPNPSVEAILHAIIPFKFVDHTHADAVVTISNSKDGSKLIKELYPNHLIVPYVMPGFILAKTIKEMTKDFNWDRCEGIILEHHGIFTFSDNAKESYEKMIEQVSLAEEFLDKNAPLSIEARTPRDFDTDRLKSAIEKAKGHEVTMKTNTSPEALEYVSRENIKEFCTQGILTPEHIIRTKREPLVLEGDEIEEALSEYIDRYKEYFKTYSKDEIMLNPAPNYAVIKDFGVVSFGKNQKEADIINDIVSHTMLALLRAEKLGGYKSISLKDCFDMEYWELEQAKLKKN